MNEKKLILKESRKIRTKLLWKFIEAKGKIPWPEIHREREKEMEIARKKISRYEYAIRKANREKEEGL